MELRAAGRYRWALTGFPGPCLIPSKGFQKSCGGLHDEPFLGHDSNGARFQCYTMIFSLFLYYVDNQLMSINRYEF